MRDLGNIYDLAFSPDNRRMLLFSHPDRVEERTLSDNQVVHGLDEFNGPVLDFQFSFDDRFLLVEYEGLSKIYEIASGQPVLALPNSEVAFSPNSHNIAIGYAAGHIEIVSLDTNINLQTLSGHPAPIWDIVFSSPDELISTASDCSTYKWNLSIGERILIFGDVMVETFNDTEEARFDGLGISSDGNLLLGTYKANKDWWVGWDLLTGSFQGFLQNSLFARNRASSPSNEIIIEGIGYGSGIDVKDKQGQVLLTIHGHTDDVTVIRFSTKGHFFATGSINGTVRIWGIAP